MQYHPGAGMYHGIRPAAFPVAPVVPVAPVTGSVTYSPPGRSSLGSPVKEPESGGKPAAGGVAAMKRRLKRAESTHVFKTVNDPTSDTVKVFCEKCGGEHHSGNHDPHAHPERSRAISNEIGDTIWNAVHGPYAAPTMDNLQALREQYEIEAGQKVYLTRESEHSYRGGRLHEGVSRNVRYYLTLEDGEIVHDFQAVRQEPPPPPVLEPHTRSSHRHVFRRRKKYRPPRRYPAQHRPPWNSSGPHGMKDDVKPWADWR